ncbi:N-acetyltransferase [Bradyrhizobium sp. U87765 SZCCT0131]|uniref:GNAT family N-acetyltransferase n=1 Tax=unclassified Bradyrhizobium TaxID=2631580 RepID=UPI001BADB7A7|nr:MULTISPECIES: N-acetyltransferase [unclassified Bradyrhizobium]MBR1217402.1 N-acetyltransferase [Bradyrhizobium sp. U87765 SZCCT0131]MBR1265001.1 N-acetyltransferase [Bradyrhizobium sp. U87765 SZCCT0134]MBR1304983.1 N-acetyltransferase [Bradyrhizobium sp. U87765 SZCCT0110]MBR1320769.1 N-acetyltransferase [Bradyrhizobium sp. U87765 SZCCT0109]MBR1349189.1 N-acetyltransferase [Bradyrhizobium sp. U87765 SZCCT0048]
MNIRLETAADRAAIHRIVSGAFGTAAEADLVDRLRADGDLLLSLVAEQDGAIIGHVAFSRLWIDTNGTQVAGVSLAPVAVDAAHRCKGIAQALIEDGHRRLHAGGETIAFVLGDPAYYGRFGYSAASAAGFACEYAGPGFQALALASAAPGQGRIAYAGAFERLGAA